MRQYPSAQIDEPAFSDQISIYEDGDPIDAESVENVPLKQLQENDLFLKKQIEKGALVEEATVDEVQEIISGEYDPYADGEDDTGELDPDTGEIIQEATDEEVEDLMDSYWTD